MDLQTNHPGEKKMLILLLPLHCVLAQAFSSVQVIVLQNSLTTQLGNNIILSVSLLIDLIHDLNEEILQCIDGRVVIAQN